jgi:hypothetical protein
MRRTGFALFTIWCCFLARAWFYCAAVPLWEGYDEYSHFALIQYVFTHHGNFPLGAIPPGISRAVSASRKLTPGAWVIHDARNGILSYEDYFDLPTAERNSRRARLENIPLEWSRQEAGPDEPIYEAQQAPLYYWIMAPFYGMLQGWSIPSTIFILRLLTAFMASATVPLAFLVGRRVLRDDGMALGAAVIVVSFPQLLILIGHVGNEELTACVAGLFILSALRMLESDPSTWAGLWLGASLGAALLTKAYVLALLPTAAVVVWLAWRRDVVSHVQAVGQGAAALCTSMAIGGWWYVHNILTTGSLTGQFEDVHGMANRQVSLLSAIGRIHWTSVLDFMATSQIWLGGWSFLGVRSWMYRIVELIAVLAIAGVCAQTVRKRPGLPRPGGLWLLALPYLTMVAGLCFYATQVFRTRGSAATPGYYLYALVVPTAVLLVAGLARLMLVKLRLLPVPFAALVLIAVEQFGACCVMFPYYAGLIRHLPNGALPAASIRQYAHGGLTTFFDRLSAIAPVSSPVTLAAMAILYGSATLILLWSACRICTLASRPES